MADDTLVALWRETFQNYKDSTDGTHDLQHDKSLKDLKTLDDLESLIESKGEDFKNFRGRNQKLWGTLKKLSQPLIALSSIVSGAISLTPYAPASLIFGAGLYLIESAHGVSGAYDEVDGVLTKISLALERFDEYRQFDHLDPRLKRRIVEIFCKSIEIIGHSQSLVRKGRGRTFISKVFGNDNKIFALKSDLDTLVEAEGRLVGALTYRGVRRAESKLDGLTN